MAFSKTMEEVMEDQAFAEKLGSLEKKEDISAAFAEKGIDIEKEMGLNGEEEELDESALEDATGGSVSLVVLAAAAASAWKVGTSAGILIRAYYDAKKYGNPYRSYSKEKVDSLLKKLNVI